MAHPKRTFSLHKVREVSLPEAPLERDYHLLRLVGEGSYGQVHLAVHRRTGLRIALKCVRKERTSQRDFLREFHYSYFLSPHRHILDAYDVAFQTDAHYVFAQELAPLGDLARALDDGRPPLDEGRVKAVCRQVASALDFLHGATLVHRDVRPHNVLLFDRDFALVKLTDFGLTRPAGTLVKKANVGLAYVPPEICDAVYNEGYTVEASADVWQLAILALVCLTRRLPWQRADITDARYIEFAQWQKRKTTRTPPAFKAFSQRLLRMLRRMLEPKAESRTPVRELLKYVDDRWLLGKCAAERAPGGGGGSVGEGSRERRDSLGRLLMSYGVETTVSRETKTRRISDWILSTSP